MLNGKRLGWLVASEALRSAMRSSGSSAPRQSRDGGSDDDVDGCTAGLIGCGCLVGLIFFFMLVIAMCGDQ